MPRTASGVRGIAVSGITSEVRESSGDRVDARI